jgi:chloride channel protein, CIC family
MRIAEIMTRNVRTVSPGLEAETAWQEMQAARIHHLVVIENDDIIGIVSERDLGNERGTALREGKRVADLMTPTVIFAWPETTVRRAANLMRGQTVGCLPVMDGKTLVGIVTTTDLLELIGHGTARPTVDSERWVLRGRGPRRPAIRRAIKRTGYT